jgi:hypothetical protein
MNSRAKAIVMQRAHIDFSHAAANAMAMILLPPNILTLRLSPLQTLYSTRAGKGYNVTLY